MFSFAQTIEHCNWNKSKQRVKNINQTTNDCKYLINDLVNNLVKLVKHTYHAELINGIPSPSIIKLKLVNFINRKTDDTEQPSLHKLINRFISGEIKFKCKENGHSTIKTY